MAGKELGAGGGCQAAGASGGARFPPGAAGAWVMGALCQALPGARSVPTEPCRRLLVVPALLCLGAARRGWDIHHCQAAGHAGVKTRLQLPGSAAAKSMGWMDG